MSANKHLVAAVVLACVGSGCSIGKPLEQRPTANQAAANPPAQAVVLHGIRWEPALADAVAAARTDPGRPIVLLRLLGTLDDRL